MKSLAELPKEEAQGLAGLLFDLDDTLLDHGVLTEAAYAALWKLSRAGLRLVAVTGRPAGWGEVIARQWPIDGAVTENGAVALFRDGAVVRRHEEADEATRRARRIRIAQAFETLREKFPEVRASEDSAARWSDLALDVGETQKVPADRIAQIDEAARALGMRTFLSSVHLHLTLDPHDKASGALAFLATRFGEEPTSARVRWAFVGDSGNDAACFAAFRTTFGVANVARWVPMLSVPPRYVAASERGKGFVEVAERVLEARRGGG